MKSKIIIKTNDYLIDLKKNKNLIKLFKFMKSSLIII
jgi:hypothetical protein